MGKVIVDGLCFSSFGASIIFSIIGTEDDYNKLSCLASKSGEISLQAGSDGKNILTGALTVLKVSKKKTQYHPRALEISTEGILRFD